MMNFQACTTERTDRLIVVTESGRKFTIQNTSNLLVKQVKVDGCLIKDDKQRCDYLFEIEGKLLIIYLELKGKDINHAYEQLISTIEICLKRHEKFKKIAYIVASRVPKITPKIQNLKFKIQKIAKLEIATHKGKIAI